MIGEVFDNKEGRQILKNANYADFNETGLIVYAKENVLFVSNSNGTVLKEHSLSNRIKNIVADREANCLLVTDEKENLNLINFSEGTQTKEFKEILLGYNFQSKRFITRTKENKSLKKDTIELVLRDFSGKELKRLPIANGIESYSFNEVRGNILLKSNKLPNSNSQVLYLFDDKLNVKGTFFLTPNDAYGFSRDGETVYYVRDNELAVFDNKKFLDLINFEAINDWLESEKRNNKHYKTDIKNLRRKYDIDRFPSQLLGFLFLR